MKDHKKRGFGESLQGLLNKELNPTVAVLGMVFFMGVLPALVLGGLVGGALWLGAKAVMALATTGSLAGVLSPGAALGAAGLLAAGHFTGVNGAIADNFSRLVLRRDPDAPEKAAPPPEKPSAAWTDLCRDLNTRRDFARAAPKNEPPEAPPPPSPPTLKPAP